ncbi:MAG: sn-glycerol-3-phosphate ABC transporter ATP-binding protein UgpC [Chloroflexi bacterium]|nr:sn-glycerol-3-phosphate ABC transporter ATP-binding protein UgpC [Chloroflexota bacterium]
MASVILDRVTKTFGDFAAVNDLTIEIRDKEFLVLVGPSGCGKSTALRMIAGLEDVTLGSIFIGNRKVNDLPPKDRDIAMVFQNYALYPHMSVYDNLAFGLKLRGTPRMEIDRRIGEAAEMLGIDGLLKRKPKQLSGGQRQRVAVGRAIVREPKAFLMDEPLSNLDAKLRVQTRAELVKLHNRLQSTVIYVTHDQVEAMTMGSRIAVLKDGILQQLESPQTIYGQPANMFVAEFIGSPAMNFFDARLVGKSEEIRLEGNSFDLKLPASKAAKLTGLIGKQIVMGVRPEHLMERTNGHRVDGDVLRAHIDVVEPLGSEAILTLKTGGKDFVARTAYSSELRPGKEIDVVVDMEKVHFFDPNTQAAIR